MTLRCRKRPLKNYPRGEKPIITRPADVLDPELDKAKTETDGLARDMDDVLVYALVPNNWETLPALEVWP